MTTLHELSAKTLDGKDLALSAYRGKAVLFVNVASRCGYTPQYKGLEALHRAWKDKGLAVVGVPCNQFGAQEPGTADEIRSFCSTTYDVTFDLLAKMDVNGTDAHPLYQWLTAQQTPNGTGPIKWNFEKFLVNGQGKVVARFGSAVTPASTELQQAIEGALR